MDDPAIGKFVKARITWRNGPAWLVGKVKEIKRDGDALILGSGWNINLDHGDELIWCADNECPRGVM